MSAWANVATIGKTKNLQGGLLVYAREGLPFLLEEGKEVTFVPPVLRLPRTGRVVQVTPMPDGAHLVFFDTIDSIERAEKLQDHYCLMRRSDLPANYDQGMTDLVGFELVDPDRKIIGEIVSYEKNPAHPLLVVDLVASLDQNGEGHPPAPRKTSIARVPLVEDFIVSIDPRERRIVMELPAGLLDL